MDKSIKRAKEAGASVLLLLIAVIFALALIKISNLSQIQIWSILIIEIVCLVLAYFSFRKQKNNYSGNDWFNEIIEKLKDNDEARIFLRDFQHPDNFRAKHRHQLKEIMELFKQKISNGEDIRIIAYCPNGEKNGLKWLESELSGNVNSIQNLSKAIKIIKKQPVGSTLPSIYIFSDNSVLFNQIIDGKILYHCQNHSNSILFNLIEHGYYLMDDKNE